MQTILTMIVIKQRASRAQIKQGKQEYKIKILWNWDIRTSKITQTRLGYKSHKHEKGKTETYIEHYTN